MRKITTEAINAFLNCKSFKFNNTQVTVFSRDKNLSSWKKYGKEMDNYTSLVLHGNTIATRYQFIDGSTSIEITNA